VPITAYKAKRYNAYKSQPNGHCFACGIVKPDRWWVPNPNPNRPTVHILHRGNRTVTWSVCNWWRLAVWHGFMPNHCTACYMYICFSNTAAGIGPDTNEDW